MKNHILEINKRMSKGGRKNIRMVLLTIHKEGEMNRNGITWIEQYVQDNLESIKGIPICASFLDESKEDLYDHGYTETIELEDGKSEPLFLNSESVGVIEDAKIEELEIDGETKKVLVGYGYIFCQRYPNLCEKLETTQVKSSIEIMGKEQNDRKIIYDGGYKEKGRKPMEFDFSGTCLLAVLEADENCYVLEVAENMNKEEKTNIMDEKELKELIQTTISETNSKNDELNAQIAELNSQLEAKDTTISELNASVEQLQATLKKLEDDQRTYWEEREILEKELAKAKVAEKLAELDSALSEFNEDEKKCAEEDIENLKANLNACKKEDNACGDKKEMGACKKELDECKKELDNATSEINSIVDKICRNIVTNQKKAEAEAKVAEQNSAKEQKDIETVDIFSEMCSETQTENEDVNIF